VRLAPALRDARQLPPAGGRRLFFGFLGFCGSGG
jgi:hypothetical protein